MRKGFGCGAVGDTRVDLASGQSQRVQGAHLHESSDLHTAIVPRFVD